MDFRRQAAEEHDLLLDIGWSRFGVIYHDQDQNSMIRLEYMVAAFFMDTTAAKVPLGYWQDVTTTLTLSTSVTFGLLKVDIRSITFTDAAACWV